MNTKNQNDKQGFQVMKTTEENSMENRSRKGTSRDQSPVVRQATPVTPNQNSDLDHIVMPPNGKSSKVSTARKNNDTTGRITTNMKIDHRKPLTPTSPPCKIEGSHPDSAKSEDTEHLNSPMMNTKTNLDNQTLFGKQSDNMTNNVGGIGGGPLSDRTGTSRGGNVLPIADHIIMPSLEPMGPLSSQQQ